jgi:hypothetical protein
LEERKTVYREFFRKVGKGIAPGATLRDVFQGACFVTGNKVFFDGAGEFPFPEVARNLFPISGEKGNAGKANAPADNHGCSGLFLPGKTDFPV